ncbi:MAG: major capsid protein [Microviridae sp.]|nr:MAG: major capsid protein [Microviridae sp.]
MKVSKKADIFNKVSIGTPKRNTFDLSHEKLFTCDMGMAVPILCEEAYPNEHWSVGSTTLCRTAPLARPMMSTVTIKKQNYFIRNQILWSNWNLFITGGDKFQEAAPVPVAPYVTIPIGGFPVGSLADYLGFPTLQGQGMKVSAFPFAAYLRTMQEYFFDENLQNTTLIMLADGDNTIAFQTFPWMGGTRNLLTSPPLPVCWEKDYFTAALPEPQKGPEVTIPLGDTADIVWNTESPSGAAPLYRGDGTTPAADGGLDSFSIGTDNFMQANGDGFPLVMDNTAYMKVDLSSATSATINDLRRSYALQRLYERLNRGGSRTPEFLRSVWGANPKNLELDRPDYFGGAKEFLSISEVLQQSQTTTDGDDASPQGNMSGHGVAVVGSNMSQYSTNDYGVMLSLFWVKPKTMYMQGVRRSWLRLDNRFDYFFPDLANIGEQPVLNAEVFFRADSDANAETFGYMPYGTDLRYIPDTVHGEFRSTQKDWTLVREFESLAPPALNEAFVVCDPSKRVFVDTSPLTHSIYVQHLNKLFVKRCIPLFGTPNP